MASLSAKGIWNGWSPVFQTRAPLFRSYSGKATNGSMTWQQSFPDNIIVLKDMAANWEIDC
jgi:hypothetical protein